MVASVRWAGGSAHSGAAPAGARLHLVEVSGAEERDARGRGVQTDR